MTVEVRRVDLAEVRRVIAGIDRSEHVDVQYEVVDGELRERPVQMADIPAWYPEGDGEFTVESYVREQERLVRAGAAMFAAFVGDDVGGAATVDPTFEPPMAWFAFLHVSRPHRRSGVASALWTATADLARASGATSMYVSAIPTGSALGFYLSRGCRLADPPHPELFAHEPEDIHLVCDL